MNSFLFSFVQMNSNISKQNQLFLKLSKPNSKMFCTRFNLFKSPINQRLASSSTIFSLSSGHGKCGVSVIRVSGPCTQSAIKAIISDDFKPKPRYASLKSLRHPITKEVIDRGLVLWFPGPHSFTGEDCCEFQVHGSLAVVAALYDALLAVNGLRLAKPGEFTKRAFFGGKLDLTEVEGLADLIHSETEAQRKQALLQSTGALSKIYKKWREQLIRDIAHLEAYIDFAEDQNIEDDVIEKLKADIKKILHEIGNHITDQRQGEMLRNGVKTVIIGAPNVGKSSLLNIICQKQVSIVTPIAGTTRDIIESAYNIGGYPVVFADTAGLRKNTDDTIENEGINRAVKYIEHTDLVLLVVDACDFVSFIKMKGSVNEKSIKETYLNAIDIDYKLIENKSILMIANKIDLLDNSDLKYLRRMDNLICVSCKENLNIDNILDSLAKKLQNLCGQPCAENPRLTHSRYRYLLTECIEHLKDFLENYSPDINPDLAIAAEKLRKAIRCIERITGDVSTEEILDVIFRDFCIGK